MISLDKLRVLKSYIGVEQPLSAIVGIVNPLADSLPHEMIHRMMSMLADYPSDDRRTWHGEGISMGCHAQWITPQSRHERLPYYDELTHLAITADAILDNRSDLCNQLQIEYSQRSEMTDSELILRAYRRWGEDVPRYLIGDFTFVIWDARERKLFGARDMLGNRTLYYVNHHNQFAFSTVMPPLHALDHVKQELNESWLAQFLAIPTMLEVGDVTITPYNHIYHISPAHAFTVTRNGLKQWKYHTFEAPDKPLRLRSNGEYEEALQSVLQEAVNSKIRTFKRVSSSLSGGLDSGAVVSLAAIALRERNKTLHTYSSIPSADFIDWSSRRTFANESPYIEATVQHVGGLQHRYMDFAQENPYTEIDHWIKLLGAPYKCFENSFWLRGFFEQAKQDDARVLLTGAGGNLSVSWGSGIDYYGHLLKRMKWLTFNRELKQYGQKMRLRRKYLFRTIVETAFPSLDRSISAASLSEIFPTLIHPDLAQRTRVEEQLKHVEVGLPSDKSNFIEARANEFTKLLYPHMSGTLATLMSLQYGVIERDPTYDPRVIQFCLSVPLEQYVQNGMDRSLIRRATAGYLPDKVRLNQQLRGLQGSDWLHRTIPSWDLVMDELNQLCDDHRFEGILDTKQIKKSRDAIGPSPQPNQAYDPNARLLMRSIIVYRFLKQMAMTPTMRGGDFNVQSNEERMAGSFY